MGLDMYFFARQKAVAEANEPASANEPVEIAYWRKHNRLMGALNDVLGTEIENCEDYPITEDILDQLEARAKERNLGDCQDGFFWGGDYEYDDEQAEYDLEQFQAARKALADGDAVFFHAWW